MHRALKITVKLAFVALAIAALGAVVMHLWNWLMPALFTGVHPIDYPHAMGLLVLSRILFGGFRGHGGGWHHRWHHHRLAHMTPEEREKVHAGLQAWRGHGHGRGHGGWHRGPAHEES